MSNKLHEALSRGFMTACSGDGEYQIKITFKTMVDLHSAHAEIIAASVPGPAGAPDSLDDTYEKLGRILYEEMEHLAPSGPDGPVDWQDLSNWSRSLYLNCVERLVEERELLDRASHLAKSRQNPRSG